MTNANSEANKKKWQDPIYRERVSKKISISQKKKYEDPVFREKQLKILKEARENHKEALLMANKGEEKRKKMSETMKKRCQDQSYIEKMRERAQKSHSPPEYRKKLSESLKSSKKAQDHLKQIHNDPEIERKRNEASHTPEVEKKRSESWHKSPRAKLGIEKANKSEKMYQWRHSQRCKDLLYEISRTEGAISNHKEAMNTSPKVKLHLKNISLKYPTKLERFIYDFLDSQGVQYISQKTIKLPEKWIRVDCFVEPNKIIEADGKVFHTKGLHPFGCEIHDEERDLELNRLGFEVLRLPEDDIKQHPDEARNRILDFLIPSRVEDYV